MPIHHEIERRLKEIRGGARRRAPTVRVLAAYAGHTDCALATLGFAASVDFDQLLIGTGFEASFGQSPFAITRGNAFERFIADKGYGPTLELLRTQMGFSVEEARIENLRQGYPKNLEGMRLRARDTRELIRQIVLQAPSAPNLIDGAVLEKKIGGTRARFEADALAARFGGQIHAGEVKSFPVVDGRADPEKLAAALDQAAIYILLTQELVEQLGGSPDMVSTDALLITPKNVGMTPTLSKKDVSPRIKRIERLLSRVPTAQDLVAEVPSDVGFSEVANQAADPGQRVDALHALADRVGTSYNMSCLSTCGNAHFCRQRAFDAGKPCLSGPHAERLLPGIRTLNRAAELAAGAPPSVEEAPVATQLTRAARLYDAHAPMPPIAASQGPSRRST